MEVEDHSEDVNQDCEEKSMDSHYSKSVNEEESDAENSNQYYREDDDESLQNYDDEESRQDDRSASDVEDSVPPVEERPKTKLQLLKEKALSRIKATPKLQSADFVVDLSEGCLESPKRCYNPIDESQSKFDKILNKTVTTPKSESRKDWRSIKSEYSKRMAEDRARGLIIRRKQFNEDNELSDDEEEEEEEYVDDEEEYGEEYEGDENNVADNQDEEGHVNVEADADIEDSDNEEDDVNVEDKDDEDGYIDVEGIDDEELDVGGIDNVVKGDEKDDDYKENAVVDSVDDLSDTPVGDVEESEGDEEELLIKSIRKKKNVLESDEEDIEVEDVEEIEDVNVDDVDESDMEIDVVNDSGTSDKLNEEVSSNKHFSETEEDFGDEYKASISPMEMIEEIIYDEFLNRLDETDLAQVLLELTGFLREPPSVYEKLTEKLDHIKAPQLSRKRRVQIDSDDALPVKKPVLDDDIFQFEDNVVEDVSDTQTSRVLLLDQDEEVQIKTVVDTLRWETESDVVDVGSVTKTTKAQKDYLEDEAELSGSDVGSEADDDEDVNEYLEEAGDEDNVDLDEVRGQNAKTMMKLQRDEDDRLMEHVKEKYELSESDRWDRSFRYRFRDNDNVQIDWGSNEENDENETDDPVVSINDLDTVVQKIAHGEEVVDSGISTVFKADGTNTTGDDRGKRSLQLR
ncbi:unnamed protein product [Bursaphelenchus okinawaensis]|uniref:Uncharacterized protein n=1 Tax=Bursaphelenchus okinawaensis TaxID=465554 RepID=A0A811KJA4_9BILA|nr:unnamed protein product [Bursaphelenchus okinawaensis]CAG9103972.1 unnamed protein product [Bursaphelenchus okinawaensis]